MSSSPLGWKLVRLGSILTYLDERIRLEDDTEYLTITVRRRHGGLEIRERLFGHQIKTQKQFRLIPGAFIISRIQCWHQAYAIVGEFPANAIASSNYDQFEISPEVDKRFFWWLSHSPDFTEAVRASASGVVIEKMVFDRDAWLAKSLRMPLLAEQRRIVAQIDELAAKVNESRLLSEQALTESGALVVSTHIKLSGTRTRTLGQILRLDEDSIAVVPSQAYPQIGIRSFGAGLFGKQAVVGAETTYKNFNKLYDGAVILSQVKGWEGAVAVCAAEFAGWFASPEYRTFRCNPEEARPGYLAALVKTKWFWSRLAQATRGVGARRERTRPEQFLAIEIPMPELEQQKRGEAVFAQLHAAKRLQTETALELDALLSSILDRAFNGGL
jgi:type I restriction enzyme S subunit